MTDMVEVAVREMVGGWNEVFCWVPQICHRPGVSTLQRMVVPAGPRG